MTKLSHMELHKRAKGLAVVCHVCFQATMHIQNGYLLVTDKHGSQLHSNVLTADDLEQLAALVRESAQKNARKKSAA